MAKTNFYDGSIMTVNKKNEFSFFFQGGKKDILPPNMKNAKSLNYIPDQHRYDGVRNILEWREGNKNLETSVEQILAEKKLFPLRGKKIKRMRVRVRLRRLVAAF